MKKFKVLRYDSLEQFEEGIEKQFENGYTLSSWNPDGNKVVAVFTGINVLTETTLKIVEETMRLTEEKARR